MPEIIPNWHPMFVHYSIALLSIATLLFILGKIINNPSVTKAAHINLWLGAVISIGTVVAGLYAANTVAHDAESHAQMMDHRNWAIPTAVSFIALAVWSAWKCRKTINVSWLFIILMVVATGALSATGFKVAELVYRHGTGVMSLPDSSGEGHAGHAHPDGEHTNTKGNHHNTAKNRKKHDDGHNHEH